MSKPAAIPFFGDAYLADTTHLTTEEHGVYFLLMLAAWRQPTCDLPNDDRKLARIAGLSARKWAAIKTTILDFWTVENDRIFQARLRKEFDFACKKSESNRKSAQARWNNQPTENKQNDKCDRISDCNAPPPPPISNISDNDKSLSSPNSRLDAGVGDDSNPKSDDPASKPDKPELPVEEAVECWMLAADRTGWAKPKLPLTPQRRTKLQSRLREHGLDGWKDALRRAMRGMLGHDPPQWFSFDFMTKNRENILKVLEGNYDRSFNERPATGPANGKATAIDALETIERRRADRANQAIGGNGVRGIARAG